MRTKTKRQLLAGTLLVGLLPIASLKAGPPEGRGMPQEMREVIHGLFDSHHKIERDVEFTETGYRATTTSKDPATATLLQSHIKQMQGRLKSGRMVRRWDPAFEEFAQHYQAIKFTVEKIDGGISVVADGSTEQAREVARNHADIISQFVEEGWKQHDVKHPIAFFPEEEKVSPLEKAEIGNTSNVHRSGSLYFGAQPGLEDLKAAGEMGIATVLSVRHNEELDFNERDIVEELGMRFVQVPWNGAEELTDDIFDQIRAILHSMRGPALFHCGSANRVGAVWLPWRVLDQKVDLEIAEKEARKIGLRSDAYAEKARAYVEARKDLPTPSAAQLDEAREIGKSAAEALMKNLGSQLKAALASGTPARAIEVCKSVAQPITQSTGENFTGISIGRTSLKTRNSIFNQPDQTDLRVLTAWEAEVKKAGEVEPELVLIHENRVRYYQPIFVGKVCLTCHGPKDSLDEQLLEILNDSYPEDEATGYQEGDLRGAFRVAIDLQQALGRPSLN